MPSIAWCILLFLVIFSCKKPVDETPLDLPPTISEENVQLKLDSLLHSLQAGTYSCFDNLKYIDSVRKFYERTEYRLLWFEPMTQDAFDQLLSEFDLADVHGLSRNYYAPDLLSYVYHHLDTVKDEQVIHSTLAELEILTTHGFLEMSNDIRAGRAEVDSVFGRAYQLPRHRPDPSEFYKILRIKKKDKWLNEFHQDNQGYVTLVNDLQPFLVQYKSGLNWIEPDTTGHSKIEKGDTADLLPDLAQRLVQMGEIDSAVASALDTNIFTTNWYWVIKNLQESYGLYADGVIGYNTYTILLTPLRDRINEYRANLERLRWFRLPEEKPFVQVNLPEFAVYMHYPDSLKSMKVCIGKKRGKNYDAQMAKYRETKRWYDRPKDHETPQIHSKIEYLVMNPTWTVPNSIIAREMYWKMRRDTGYLRRNGYRVYYEKKELRSDSIDWSKFRANKIPFRIVQDPSSDNSLGRIKFIFRNPFHIYLHDTPLKSKFKLSSRAVSHGCVRVEDPIQFLEFVSQGIKKYNYDDLRIMMGYEPLDKERLEEWDPADTTAEIQPTMETTTIFLQKPIPIYFTYRTLWVDELGSLQRRFDIYRKNPQIIAYLDTY